MGRPGLTKSGPSAFRPNVLHRGKRAQKNLKFTLSPYFRRFCEIATGGGGYPLVRRPPLDRNLAEWSLRRRQQFRPLAAQRLVEER